MAEGRTFFQIAPWLILSPGLLLGLTVLSINLVGDGLLRAVDGLSYKLDVGEMLGIVGESGCGKSVGALSILGLIPMPPGRIVGGSIRFRGRELVGLDEPSMRAIRGNEISVIFQEP